MKQLIILIVISYSLSSCLAIRKSRAKSINYALTLLDTTTTDSSFVQDQLLSKRKSYRIAKKIFFKEFGRYNTIYQRQMVVIYYDNNILLYSHIKRRQYVKGISYSILYDRKDGKVIEIRPKD